MTATILTILVIWLLVGLLLALALGRVIAAADRREGADDFDAADDFVSLHGHGE